MKLALAKADLTRDQVVMVGDNYNTDIRAAINTGMDSLLVYTGLSTTEQVAKMAVQPTHTVKSLDEWTID